MKKYENKEILLNDKRIDSFATNKNNLVQEQIKIK